jgi:protein tyrosine phosphatase (PTP) superfamily phosphohydrolase (DUF442 family)
MSKRLILVSILSLLSITASVGAQEPNKPAPPAKVGSEETLPRYLELASDIGTGGQPTETGMHALAEKGYKSIINLRTAEEMASVPYEEKLAGELGLKYFSIPIRGQEPKEVQALAFMQVMNSIKDEKVFVHCASANRVGALMMIWLALQQGMETSKAEAEAGRIGLRSEPLRQFARQVIEGRGKK